jgi:serine/threonine-protein phosphatase 4 regulatory subunit 1
MNQILKEEAFFLNQKHGDIHSFVLDDDQDQLLNKLLTINNMTSIDRENYTKHISYCIRNLG